MIQRNYYEGCHRPRYTREPFYDAATHDVTLDVIRRAWNLARRNSKGKPQRTDDNSARV